MLHVVDIIILFMFVEFAIQAVATATKIFGMCANKIYICDVHILRILVLYLRLIKK